MPLARALGLRLGVAAVLAVVLLVPFGLLAAFVVGDWAPLQESDAAVSGTLHSFAVGHPGWVEAMLVWSLVFSPTALRVAALVLVVWLVRRRHATAPAWWVGITMAIGGVLGALLKVLVGRGRPQLLDPVAQATGYSFPSGHALNSALTAGVFLLVLLPFVRDRPGRRAALWAAVILVPLITGICRIGLGVHFASDVVGGWLLGIAVVAVTTVAFESWRVRAGRRPVEATDAGVEPEIARQA